MRIKKNVPICTEMYRFFEYPVTVFNAGVEVMLFDI